MKNTPNRQVVNERTCRKTRAQIVRAQDASEQMLLPASVTNHLQACAACRAYAQQVEAGRAAVRNTLAVQSQPTPGILVTRALDQFHAEQAQHTETAPLKPRRGLLIVRGYTPVWAGTAVAAGVAAVWMNLSTGTPTRLSPLPPSLPSPASRGGKGETKGITGFDVSATRTGKRFVSPFPPREAGLGREGGRGDRWQSTPTRITDTHVPTQQTQNTNTSQAEYPTPNTQHLTPIPQRLTDDLAYIAPDNNAFAARWAHFAPSELEAWEASVRASIKGGDDFVDVPLSRMAFAGGIGSSAARAALADAVAAYRQESQIVDARLQKRVTLAMKRVSFADLCEELTRQTGITFTAAKGVADDKITVFCKDRPARDLLRSIARLFNFAWDRLGEEGSYRYRLKQPLQAQLLEEEMRNKDQAEALLALDRYMSGYKSLLSLSPEEAKARAENATGDDKKRLQALAGSGWGPVNLYFGLSSEQINSLRNGKSIRWGAPTNTDGNAPELAQNALSGSSASGDMETLSPDMNRQIIGSLDGISRVKMSADGVSMRISDLNAKFKPADGVPPSHVPNANSYASLQLSPTELGRFALNGGAGLRVPGKDGKGGGSIGTAQEIGEGISPSARDPKNAEANKEAANKPEMQGKTDLSGALAANDGKTGEAKNITTADLLEAIHKTTGRDVIGDYYTRLYDPKTLLVNAPTRFEALNRSCDAARLRWNAEDDWLTFRSVSFFNDRPKEVPNRLLERWATARAKNDGVLPFANIAEIATLPDVQLDAAAMSEGARVLYGLTEWEYARSTGLRRAWRLWNELSTSQRDNAFRSGMPFSNMTLAQQEAFARAVFGDSRSERATAQNLAQANISVFYGPKPASSTPPAAAATKTVPYTVRFVFRYQDNGKPYITALTPGSMMQGEDKGQPLNLW